MVLGHDILTSDRTHDIKISENVSFDSMLLSPKILNGLKSSGFYVPSPIQLHGIPLGKCGFDLLLEAKSGTGKTAVFVIIALEKLNLNKGLQTLMLAPTREIASQICDVIKTIGAYFEGLTVEVVMGGLPFAEDVEKFKKTVHIVVGSPGRLYHLIKNKHIDVSTVRLMVLDEADKLLEKSFLSDINNIFSLLPSLKQMIMSSATYPDNIKTTMKNYVLNAHHICPDSNSVLLGIEQNVTVVPGHVNIVKQTKNRYTELNKILTKKKFKQCLVFCNYQVRVGEVHKMLINDEWPADKLHGKQQQIDRLEALKILQEYKCRILVSTDLAARGIDASNIDLVVNFEIPFDWQTYLHRIGRAGRFGSYGSAVTILCEDEQNKFRLRLRSLDIPFNLKHLWSNEPFLLDLSKTVEKSPLKQENESLTEIKESVRKLETYDKVCEVLSVDSTQTNKEIHDIPTFESLCESFEGVNRDSKIDSIESFSDLCTSFHNHEIKSNENLNYKPVEDNKLIIPCNMFNGNIILQSFQKHKSSTSYTNHLIDSIDNMKEKDVENYYADDKNFSKPQEEKLLNGKPSGSRNKSETVNNDVSLPSTSKSLEYKTSMKSKANKETEENVCSTFGKIEATSRKVFLRNETSDNENYCDESVTRKPDNDHAKSFMSPEYNDCERALLAANLPTAFGKSKQNMMQSTINRDIRRTNHFSSHSQNIRNNEHKVSLKKRTVFTKGKEKQQADSVYESSDSDKTEDEIVSPSHKSLRDKKSSVDHSLNHKRNKTELTKINMKHRADSVIKSSDSVKSEDTQSDSFAHTSDSDHAKAFISSEYNDCEKALLAANLPTAFGKSKPNMMQSTINRDIRGKNDFSSHSQNKRNNDHQVSFKNKTVLTKSKEKHQADLVYESSDSDKTEDELVSQSHKPFRGRKSYIDSSLNHKTNKTVINKNNVKQRANFVYQSSEEERTEIEPSTLPCKSQKGKMSPKSHKTTRKQINNFGENNYYNDFRYHVHSVVEERQRKFDCWYQELQTNMQVLEKLVYMEEMKRLNRFY